MKTPRPYKVKLNSITLYDCETIKHAQNIVQGMRDLSIDSMLNLHDSELKKLLGSKDYKITICKNNKILNTYDLGMFYTYINAAYNRYYIRLEKRIKGGLI